MNKIYLFLVCISVSVSIVRVTQAREQSENYLKAYELYQNGLKEDAFELYSHIQPATPAVLYNTGVVAYDRGKWSQALAFWNEALPHAHAKLVKKLQQATAYVQREHGLPVDPAWYRFLWIIQSYLSFLFLQIFVLVCWYLWYFLRKTSICLLKKLRILFLLCSVVGVGQLLCMYYVRAQKIAIVGSMGASVYPAPNNKLHVLATVSQGQRVKLVDECESWYKMQYQDVLGNLEWQTGWAEQKNFESTRA